MLLERPEPRAMHADSHHALDVGDVQVWTERRVQWHLYCSVEEFRVRFRQVRGLPFRSSSVHLR